MTKIKICGITNIEDSLAVVAAGADALGFILYRKSPRFIEMSQVKKIISALPPFIISVGVFVNQEISEILDIKKETNIDVVQLHGSETPDFCMQVNSKVIKAIRVKGKNSFSTMLDYKVNGILLDTFTLGEYGGSGISFDWGLIEKKNQNIILAGGLNPENVYDAVKKVKPYGVDVSSGVEICPGKKNINKVNDFIKEVRRADYDA